jgi:hypothetical protein
MSRLSREVKSTLCASGADNRDSGQEMKTPPPLRQRISLGRGLLARPEPPALPQGAGRGLMALQRCSLVHQPGSEQVQSRPPRQSKITANIALGFADDDDDECTSEEDLLEDPTDENDCEEEAEMDPGVNVNDDSILDEENLHEIDSSSDKETSSDEEASSSPTSLVSANKTTWHTTLQRNTRGRAAARNTVSFRAGVKPGVNPASEKDAVMLYLDCVLPDIVTYSNLQGRRIAHHRNHLRPHQKKKVFVQIDRVELDAFIGLLILLGK